MMTLSRILLAYPQRRIISHKCAAFSSQSFGTVGDGCSGTVGKGAARSLQLPHIPVTAFSPTDLFLV